MTREPLARTHVDRRHRVPFIVVHRVFNNHGHHDNMVRLYIRGNEEDNVLTSSCFRPSRCFRGQEQMFRLHPTPVCSYANPISMGYHHTHLILQFPQIAIPPLTQVRLHTHLSSSNDQSTAASAVLPPHQIAVNQAKLGTM